MKNNFHLLHCSRGLRTFFTRALLVGFVLALSLSGRSVLAQEAVSSSAQIDVVSSDDQAVVLEFRLGTYSIENKMIAGVSYHQVEADGMAQSNSPDFPQVPTLGTMIGIPTTAGVAIEIVDVELVDEKNFDADGYLLPTPPQYTLGISTIDGSESNQLIERFDSEPIWLKRNAFLPHTLMTLGESGEIRGQPVTQLQFHPVQYNPAKRRLKIYQRIRAKVTWQQVVHSSALRQLNSGSAHESILQNTLANYAELKQSQMYPHVANTTAALASSTGSGLAPENTYTRLAKIHVREDGFYRISYEELVAETVGIAPLQLQDVDRLAIYNHGEQVAIEIRNGGSARFEKGDAIVFYGTQIRNNSKLMGAEGDACPGFNEARADHWYTDENVYWLVLMNTENGLRINDVDGAPDNGAASVPVDFPVIRHFEEDSRYWQTMPSQNCADRWFWGQRLANLTDPQLSERDIPLPLNATGGSTASATLMVQSFSTETQRAEIWFNGRRIAETAIAPLAREAVPFSIKVPESQETPLTLKIKAEVQGDSSGSKQFFIDSINIEYKERYDALDSEIFLFGKSTANAEAVTLTGLSTAADRYNLYDISDSLNPVRVTNTSAASPSELAFKSVASETTQGDLISCQGRLFVRGCYLAVAEGKFMTAPVAAAPQTTLRSTNNGAAHVIITHQDFVESAQKLAAQRTTTSALSSKVVTMTAIYDEFNDGIENPRAIRDFLDYAYHCWEGDQLEYVLLMGDASQDYKNLLGNSKNYVPSFNFESSLFGEISSDSWFANLATHSPVACNQGVPTNAERDTLPDLIIGRLPVDSISSAENAVRKIIVYENDVTPAGTDWKDQILFVSDDEKKFRATVDILSNTIPASYNIEEITVMDEEEHQEVGKTLLGQAPDAKADEIISAFESGQLLISYIGHGDYDAWGRWDAKGGDESLSNEYHYIFHSDYLQYVSNSDKLPVITMGNCLNGYFAGPTDRPSMAEDLLHKQNGGAIAVFAPTGLGYPSGHRILLGTFNSTIFGLTKNSTNRDDGILGVGAQSAIIGTIAANAFWSELASTYVLFGDPAMKIDVVKRVYLPFATQ